MYAAGKIPGGFFRREGRPSETAILTATPDRPPDAADASRTGYRDEVQVVITVLSVDMAHQYDIPGMNAASLATMLSRDPVRGPGRLGRMGADRRRVGHQPDVPGPRGVHVRHRGRRPPQRRRAGRHPDDRGRGARRTPGRSLQAGGTTPTEEVVAEGLEAAKRAIDELIDLQHEFVATGRRQAASRCEPTPLYGGGTCRRPPSSLQGRASRPRSCPTGPSARPSIVALEEPSLKEHLLRDLGDGDLRRARSRDLAGMEGPAEEGHASRA